VINVDNVGLEQFNVNAIPTVVLGIS